MKLAFTCPETNNLFTSEYYSLLENHVITETAAGQRTLEGMVSLDSRCPHCGRKHLFTVEEILCPLAAGEI